ncbi:ABC transporter transmembrane region domain-containing protein [Cardiosporidium cionae]|uniref:ABC transporter transmembrane region domain-containing protein n=1 Tax=Cardiosporidium cionae TaxID=476202 RepID=A0ABQ7J9Y2_9APIC|nr:ABC transporter transmembrane region domain-containing protein [Cardiosporidium cionae]|eukprot:KAF8820807.1 ABC transporter transmembrane region domain-containing protein [Cardiosporidium cionae]
MPAAHSKMEKEDTVHTDAKSASFFRIFSFLSRFDKIRLGLAFSGLCASSANNLRLPYLIGEALNRSSNPTFILGDDTPTYFLLSSLTTFGMGAFFGWLRVYYFGCVSSSLECQLRNAMFSQFLLQDTNTIGDQPSGDRLSRLVLDVDLSSKIISSTIPSLLRSLNSVIGGMIMMFWLNPKLASFSLTLVPLVGAGAMLYARRIKRLKQLQQKLLDAIFGTANERLSQLFTVRLFGKEAAEQASFNQSLQNLFPSMRKIIHADGLFMGSLSVSLYSTLFLVIYFGGLLLRSGELSMGKLASFALYSSMAGLGFSGLSQAFGDIMKAKHSLSRVFEIIDQPASSLSKGMRLTKVKGQLSLQNISFQYPSRSAVILSHLSLIIHPGEIVALCGPSGAGKSTLLYLLCQLYSPNEGSIFLDDCDISVLSPTWMRQTVFGIVEQEPVLFSGTVKQNIAYGRDISVDEDIHEAAKLANAHDFITELPKGYDTEVGERGFQLSVGQKQRIAIARAVIKNPKILLLDEATSALDGDSEKQVHTALERVMSGRTVILVAHRESTLKYAHRIVMVLEGNIHAEGTYEEMKQVEAFRTLIQAKT